MKSQLESSRFGSDSSQSVELSELRFDKQALESKLRKFAAHCQRLEDDKAGMTDALKSCSIDPSGDEDINDKIVTLCDKLAALEEAKSRRYSGDNKKLESLREENKTLLAKVQQAEENKQRANMKLKTYMERVEELQMSLEDSNENANGASSENSRKLQFLEQENLQLMLDYKSAKKQLQLSREEVEMLRLNAVENPTIDFSTIEFATVNTGEFSSLRAKKTDHALSRTSISGSAEKSNPGTTMPPTRPERKRSLHSSASPLVDATNTKEKGKRTPGAKKAKLDIPMSGTDTKKTRKSPKSELKRNRTRTPGLGEGAITDDENTAECKQS